MGRRSILEMIGLESCAMSRDMWIAKNRLAARERMKEKRIEEILFFADLLDLASNLTALDHG